MLHYYIQRGHNIKDLLALDEYEKFFYFASMDKSIKENEDLRNELNNISAFR